MAQPRPNPAGKAGGRQPVIRPIKSVSTPIKGDRLARTVTYSDGSVALVGVHGGRYRWISPPQPKRVQNAPKQSSPNLMLGVNTGSPKPPKPPKPIVGKQPAATVISKGPTGWQAVEDLVGPDLINAITGKPFSWTGLGLDAAGFLPLGKIGKVGRIADVAGEVTKGIKAGHSADEILKAAKETARTGKLPADRVVNVGGMTIRAPAAPQRQVRAVQKILDRNVEKIISKGMEKGLHPQEALAQKGVKAAIARGHVKRLTEFTGFYENKGAEAAPRALSHIKLSDPQHVALRQMARGVHPNVTIKANETRIADALSRGDKAMVTRLKKENELLRASRHYIEGSGNQIALRKGTDKATKRLHQAWNEMQRVGRESEALQIKQGELNPATAAARKAAPGELDIARAGYKGYASHEGNLYYPSAREVKQFSPKGAYRARGQILPFRPRGETKQPFTGALQETGQESIKAAQLVGKQAVSRQSRALATDRLEQLRQVAMRDTLPNVSSSRELDSTYKAIRLTASPNSAATQRLQGLLANLDQTVHVTNTEAEAVGKALQAWKEELVQLPSEVVKEGKLPKEFGLVHKSLLGALNDPKVFNVSEIGKFQRAMMNISTVAKDMVVYTKIGHAPPRLISNIIMALPDTGLDFVRGLTALPKLRKARPDLYQWVHQAMGGGYYKSVAETTGMPSKAVQGMSKALVGWIEASADRTPRNAAFLAFAIKDSGAKSTPELINYLDKLRSAPKGSEAFYARTRVLSQARQAAGEYERVGKDASLGNWIFLYRWIKASTVWTSRFVTKHPLMAGAVGAATYKYGYNAANPIYNRFNIAGHNVTTSLPYSTPVEIAERANAARKDQFPALGESPLDMLHPIIPAAAIGLGHVDIERGEKVTGNPLKAAGMDILQQVPAYSVFKGKGNLSYRIQKFLGGNFLPTTPAPTNAQVDSLVKSGVLTKQQAKHIEDEIKKIQSSPAYKRAQAKIAKIKSRKP